MYSSYVVPFDGPVIGVGLASNPTSQSKSSVVVALANGIMTSLQLPPQLLHSQSQSDMDISMEESKLNAQPMPSGVSDIHDELTFERFSQFLCIVFSRKNHLIFFFSVYYALAHKRKKKERKI